MRRKMILLVLSVLLILSFTVTVSANEFNAHRMGSITITLIDQYEDIPIKGAEFEAYHIADVSINSNKKLNYVYIPIFKDCGIELEDPDLAAKLSALVEHNSVSSYRIRTDSEGIAVCDALPLGLYLVKQVGAVEGYSTCSPFMVTVPIQNGDSFTYDVNAAPKTDVVKLVSITIKKVWNAGKTSTIPASITVHLLRDDVPVETAVLNQANNWQITYTDMPVSDAYKIREANVPKGFTATYRQKDFVFTVTNTASLAQTGQLIWPIPVLALTGLMLLMAGFVLLRKSRKDHA